MVACYIGICVELSPRAVWYWKLGMDKLPARQACNYAHDNEVNVQVYVCEEMNNCMMHPI